MFSLFRKSARERKEISQGNAALGGILLLVSFPILFINEGRAVKTVRGLKEGAAAVVAVQTQQVDSGNEGEFIHISGKAESDEQLNDGQFGVTTSGIRLVRDVEMYQWREIEEEVKRKSADGPSKTVTEYSYEQIWSPTSIDSSEFQQPAEHENPRGMPFEKQKVEAGDVRVGAFQLPASLVGKISNDQPLMVSLADVPKELAANLKVENGSSKNASGFYWSAKPDAEGPQIGDVRVRFTLTRGAEVSILSQQAGESLQPFVTRSGRELHMLKMGIRSASEMISAAEAENTAMTWGLRIFGAAMMCGGIALILRRLTSLVDQIPVLGSVAGTGATVISLVVGLSGSLLTISVAWLFYRPLIAIPLMVVCVAVIVFVVRKLRAAASSG